MIPGKAIRPTVRELLDSIKQIWPAIVLIGGIIGLIFFGIATVIEVSALGVVTAIGLAAMATCTAVLRLTQAGAVGVFFFGHGCVGSHDTRQARSRNLRYLCYGIAHDGVIHPA